MSDAWNQSSKDWTPEYSRWRHGGWYINNISYPSGANGCVSNNYPDKKWRIVCGPQDVSFASREAAAKAEYACVQMMKRVIHT